MNETAREMLAFILCRLGLYPLWMRLPSILMDEAWYCGPAILRTRDDGEALVICIWEVKGKDLA